MQMPELLAGHYQAAVKAEMARPVPNLPSKYLFDDVGFELFSQFLSSTPAHFSNIERGLIAGLDERFLQAPESIVELGSGNASTFLEWFTRGGFPDLRSFSAVDLSAARMVASLDGISTLRPQLEVTCLVGDFESSRAWVPQAGGLVCWLGNSAANFAPAALETFLSGLRQQAASLRLLLGISLNGEPEKFAGFYAAGRGIFDAFRLNSLTRMNRECGANFDLTHFRALSKYDEALRRGRSVVEATWSSHVGFKAWCGARTFEAGDQLIVGETQNYDRPEFEGLVERTGWRSEVVAMDAATRYALVLLS